MESEHGKPRPGDIIIDRYLSEGASQEERDQARRNLYEIVGALYNLTLAQVRARNAAIRAEKIEGVKSTDSSPLSP